MSDLDRNVATTPFGQTLDRVSPVATDEGLRAYMLRIYNYMVLGLAITGVAALATYMVSVTSDPTLAAMKLRDGLMLTAVGHAIFVSPLKWVVILAPLAMVFLISYRIERLSPSAAQALFWVFAALLGISLASIFLLFTHSSIVRVFFITAASFGALSLWGYTTQRDLTGLGSFLVMGLFGVILALLVNLFLQAPVVHWVISVVGALVFAGLTAYDTQRLKNVYIYATMDGEAAERSSILGALSLYLNFINLFTFLLQLLGQRDE